MNKQLHKSTQHSKTVQGDILVNNVSKKIIKPHWVSNMKEDVNMNPNQIHDNLKCFKNDRT